MKLCQLIVCIFFLGAACINARAQEEAPLGLLWGKTSSDLRERGVALTEYSDGNQWGNSFIASKLEKAIVDQDTVLLSFGFNDKLWRIAILGRHFSNDPFGSEVRARYNELVGVLSEKYGKPQWQLHRLGQSIYAEQRYFLTGIRGGESSWVSHFETPNLRAQLSIEAKDSSTGFWKLMYEYKPLKKGFDDSKRSSEKGSL